MPLSPKQDANVPFTAGRARYSTLGLKPTWHYHVMAAGTLDGAAPAAQADASDANTIDPAVSGGQAVWSGLAHGGLFTALGNYKTSVQVDEMDVPSGTVSVVTANGDGTTTARRTVAAAPFTLAPGEYLSVLGGARAGFLVRLAGEDIL